MPDDLRGSVAVEYRFRDNWHVFTSHDMPGLYIASQDPELAFNDLSTAIALLLRLDEGIEAEVTLEVGLKEFLARIRDDEPARITPELRRRRFSIGPSLPVAASA